MIRRASIAVALPILLWACAPPSPGQNGCGSAPAVDPGSTAALSIQVGDLDRRYRLHLPQGYRAGTPTPLVLAFHGYTHTAEMHEKEIAQLSAHADTHGYIVVYPQATGFQHGDLEMTSWNDLACNASPGPEGPTCVSQGGDWDLCPPECGDCGECNWCSCYDDLAFVDTLLDELQASLCVDPDRVYATGFSNGGMFVYRLGCDRADRFAAIATVSGLTVRGFKCAPSSPLSLMHVHGTRDDNAPLDGSASRYGLLLTPIDEMVDLWASPASQGCAAVAVPYPTPHDGTEQWVCSQRPDCATEAELVTCTWDGGHTWPKTADVPFGNDVIWEFFRQHGATDVVATPQ